MKPRTTVRALQFLAGGLRPAPVRLVLLLAVLGSLLGPWGAGATRAQDCGSLPQSSAEMRAELAQFEAELNQAQANIAAVAAAVGISVADASAQLAQARAALPLARACIEEKEAQEREALQAQLREQRDLIPIETNTGGDLQVPCVLRTLVCTDLEGNPTRRVDAEAQEVAPGEQRGETDECGGLSRAEIQDFIAQGQGTIAALERSRGQVAGEGAQIDARIGELRDQIAAAQATLPICRR